MAYSTVPKAKKDGQIVFNDATTPTAVTLQVAYEEGNFTFDKPVRDEIVVRDRGVITTVRQGDEQPITGSFNFYMREFTDTTNAGSLQDFINGTGNYASNASTGSGGNVYVEHYAVDRFTLWKVTTLETTQIIQRLSQSVFVFFPSLKVIQMRSPLILPVMVA